MDFIFNIIAPTLAVILVISFFVVFRCVIFSDPPVDRATIIDVARFGARMTWAEVQTALRDRQEDALFRALAQILEYQRQRCQMAVQDKSNLPDGQVAFEAGAAASAADVMAMLTEIASGNCTDRQLAAWFGGQIRTKPD